MTPILSDTLAPPSTATNGRRGCLAGLRRAFPSSRCISGPMYEGRVLGDAHRRSVRAMCGPERVVDVESPSSGSAALANRWIVRFLFLDGSAGFRAVQHVAVVHARPLRIRAPRRCSRQRAVTGHAEGLAQGGGDRRHAERLSTTFPSGRPRCDMTIMLGSALAKLAQRRNGGIDAGCVGHCGRLPAVRSRSSRTSTRLPRSRDRDLPSFSALRLLVLPSSTNAVKSASRQA